MLTNSQIRLLILGAFLGMSPVAPAQSVGVPNLPDPRDDYVGYAVTNLPAHFGDGTFGTVTSQDNTPANNPITNAGATLGRVLFYDKRLSHNNTTSCASCHVQSNGFSDPDRFSTGANGDLTSRRSMGLTNSKFYDRGKFMSDESAATLEDQVLMPIQNPLELDMNLNDLNAKLSATGFYPDLFTNAFGTTEVTSERVSKSLAQFVRSMVSYDSKFDSAFTPEGVPNFEAVFNAQEQMGRSLFNGIGRCSFCHVSNGQVAGDIHNNGLDAVTTDAGAGDGKFKSPSLRNAEVRGAYMHDGRFTTLEEVVEFYSSGVQDNPDLDFRLRDNSNGNEPFQPNFSQAEKDALVAFLETLTDATFLNDPRFSDPFVLPCDLNDDSACGIDDLNLILSAGPVADGVAVTGGNGAFDLNGDGVIDNDDVKQWREDAGAANGMVAAYLVGDANLDGQVDIMDLNIWNASRFQMSTNWNDGDFNGDGAVDLSDLHLWNQSKFTSVLPTSALPEPTTGTLLLLGLLAMAKRSASPGRCGLTVIRTKRFVHSKN